MREIHTAKGAAFMFSSGLFFCLMSILIKCASANIDIFVLTQTRFVVGLGILGTAAMSGKIKLTFSHGPLLLLRGFIGGLAVIIYYLSITKLGLAKATVIGYAFPIFGSIFSAILLKEKIGPLKAVAVVAAFAGLYLLTANGEAGVSSWASFGKYEALAVLGAVLGGFVIVMIRKLHDTDSAYAILFAQCVIGMWILLIPVGVRAEPIGYSTAFLVMALGVVATVAQLLMTQGYRYLTVATGSLLGMFAPVVLYLVGTIFFHEPFSMRSIIGAAIVITSCAVVLSANKKK